MSEEMNTDKNEITQDERTMAALAHGSVLLGIVTSGVGGIGVSLLIWLTQREKSPYAAKQAMQSLVYQVVTLLVTMVFWCCWGGLWILMMMPPLIVNPGAYENAPPPGMWVGLSLMCIPFAAWALTILYGLWAAIRCMAGDNFKYVVIGNWLERQESL
jgi:uncharacterized Tic20 family protein